METKREKGERFRSGFSISGVYVFIFFSQPLFPSPQPSLFPTTQSRLLDDARGSCVSRARPRSHLGGGVEGAGEGSAAAAALSSLPSAAAAAAVYQLLLVLQARARNRRRRRRPRRLPLQQRLVLPLVRDRRVRGGKVPDGQHRLSHARGVEGRVGPLRGVWVVGGQAADDGGEPGLHEQQEGVAARRDRFLFFFLVCGTERRIGNGGKGV